MRIITIKIASITYVIFNILALFAFPQTSHAQSNNAQEAVVKDNNSLPISPDTSKRIQAFFNNSSEVSIQRFNHQLLEVNIGARSVFASNDGRFLYVGDVIDTQEKIDISEQVAQSNRLKKLGKIDDTNQLSFPATTKELFEVTLFTDIDCGYCRRFHGSMAQYNALGIRVNYVMFPRAGKNSKSYDKTAAVLCSVNPQENMTLAMQGQLPTSTMSVKKNCQHNLDQQMSLAAEFGISATPTILLPNGGVIEGVLKPEQLLAQLIHIK